MINRFGCVYRFESNQVFRNDPKPKYHIALCIEEGSFLFINSAPFEDSFPIDKSDWPEMPKDESFVSCNRVIRYPREYFAEMSVTITGKIDDACLENLRKHLPHCDSLETRDLNYIIGIFDKYLK